MASSSDIKERFDSLIRSLMQRHNYKNRKDLCENFGSIKENTLSRIITTDREIKESDILDLLRLDGSINLTWLFIGIGEMFHEIAPGGEYVKKSELQEMIHSFREEMDLKMKTLPKLRDSED